MGHCLDLVTRPWTSVYQLPFSWPWAARKWLSRNHCCWGRSKPGGQIVGSSSACDLTHQSWLPVFPLATSEAKWLQVTQQWLMWCELPLSWVYDIRMTQCRSVMRVSFNNIVDSYTLVNYHHERVVAKSALHISQSSTLTANIYLKMSDLYTKIHTTTDSINPEWKCS